MTQDAFSLTGKVALVTGASSGLGRHFAGVLADAGANVLAAARRTDRLEALAQSRPDGRIAAFELDVTDPKSVQSVLASVGDIDVVVNCAGIAEIGSFEEMGDAEWRKVMDVNLDGLRRVSQEAVRRMIEAERRGVIVNVASIAGVGAAPGYSVYATSKAAVIHLTRCMATELWRYGIRVNALCPGYFRTEMNEAFFASERGRQYLERIPPRRTGELEELTGPLLLLASDASSYMTGAAIPVDGGQSIRML